jgi:hypothetical protein
VFEHVQVTHVPAVQLAGLTSVIAVDADDLAAEVADQLEHVGLVMDASGASRPPPVDWRRHRRDRRAHRVP